MAWHLPFDLTSWWGRNDSTIWLLPGQGTGPRVWILSLCYCCQPSHSSQARSREMRIWCSEKTNPLSDSCFVWADFFFQKENHHISQQRPSFFSTFMLLDFSDPTVWGHEEQSQEWFLEEVETPPGNTSFFLASSPEFPTGSCVRQAGGWMAWGLPPSLPSRFLEAHPELMTVSRLQSRGGLHRGPLQAHSNSLRKEKLRSPTREGADSDQQLQNGCWPCQHKQLLNFHYKRFSSTRGTLCITEIASHPKRSTLKRGPCGTRSSWAKSIYPSTEILTAEQDAVVDSGLWSQNRAFWILPGSIN